MSTPRTHNLTHPRTRSRLRHALILAVVASVTGLATPLAAQAQLSPAAAESLASYFDFIDANGGTLMAEQIPAEDYRRLHVLDVRDASQYAVSHIPGAVNIEWRQVFAERARLPKDRTVLVYCNTSSFAAQVAMALRMDGMENVRVLRGGYTEWKARGGMDAHARASQAR
ncbi:rhodanese-like domain-containing protein [Sphaerotilus mobilis]|uniref:Rhodanese-related sulfurtransferase n=1 Tax=Sphaerotilus mobilis TaxID=47994 RepID=A0A4V2EW67_9BURK|nr:rhodanese-like domain-containing protein [Sphaerotilus mobilis]RZS54930.1 rhodanese-related sulfurtransferase [Sphaerotilus mobilis]